MKITPAHTLPRPTLLIYSLNLLLVPASHLLLTHTPPSHKQAGIQGKGGDRS